MESLSSQLYGISKSIQQGEYQIPDIGDLLPASLMIQDLDGLTPIGCSYMNNWGCEKLGTSVDIINKLGPAYYEQFFLKEEIASIILGVGSFLSEGDFDKQYNFFQRVKLHGDKDYTWFYTITKLFRIPVQGKLENKLLLISSPVTGVDSLISRVNKTLNQDQYIRNNYRRFASLTVREKEIITLMANGKSSPEIGEKLFISPHTVYTHRKNINRKIECDSFAGLLQFAIAFDLI